MKRSEKLLDAIGQIDDRLVEDAAKAGQDPAEKELSSGAAPVLPMEKAHADENGKIRTAERENESVKADRRKPGKKRKNPRRMKKAAMYRWQGALAACAVVAVCAGIFGLLNRSGLLLSPYDSGSTASGSEEMAMDAAGALGAVPEIMQDQEAENADAASAQKEESQSADEAQSASEASEKQDAAQTRSGAAADTKEAMQEEAGISAQSADEGITEQAKNGDGKSEAASENSALTEGEQKAATADPITAFVRENTAESVQLVIENHGNTTILFGQAYAVEQLTEDGSWQALSAASENIAWGEVEYFVNSGDTWEETLPVGSLYGTLEPGQYRIVKYYKTEGDEQEKALYAAFAVPE